ncbi:hypothetical protein CU097_014798 [Rhizopus azygosporus]|uniref:26S proteasome complex subunit SEM1 n=2 Tax=Rhizopus TaxID=4842 RepID=A0A367K7S8_RHIAZ|nr:26S proteasome complex subunit DSS1 [Rhizopus microsporus]RCH98206.1 hypothetical protein CU097_014798 [Rhizopus azygosporus]CEG65375.1 Putative 26S proteasome complex subunit DSS1 [Rhizopus microsporus]CEI90747.1 Putative 26S proteasome complex subunit DSS1 [Rhizopus microsporus]CEI97640.1 Putative 26S proteasome complex subunit DSS1 [Rhizopus microsporus]
MATTQNQDKQKSITEEKNLAALGVLEEDDEFEEFATEDWGEDEEDQSDAHFWEDNWDDDDIDDAFSKQLRAELEKEPNQPQPMKM